MSQRLIVGVDPHRKKNVMQLMDSQGQVVGPPLRVANNRPGTVSFVEYLVEQMERGDYETIRNNFV